MHRILFKNYKTETAIKVKLSFYDYLKLLVWYPLETVSTPINRLKILCYKMRFPGQIQIGKQVIPTGSFKLNFREEENEKGSITIHNNVFFRSGEDYKNNITSTHGGTVEIMENAFLHGVKILSYKHISIGKNVLIGWGTEILDSDCHPIDKQHPLQSKDVIIEDNAWIASDCIILKGVTIGEGSVVAAGSVVHNDVPAHTLVAGNPAKKIKKIGKR
jgi:acetyltransferase-like isoleucine patch superfamily enzyme